MRCPRPLMACAVVLAAALSGCSSMGGTWQRMMGPNEDDLPTTVSAYCKYLMYRDYDKARAFIVRPDRENYARYFASAGEKLRIESYSVQDAEFYDEDTPPPGWDEASGANPPPPQWARALVVFQYVFLPSNIVRKGIHEQTWIAVAGEWMLLFPAKGPGF